MALEKCLSCGKEVDSLAKFCPNCGRPNPTRENSNEFNSTDGCTGCMGCAFALLILVAIIWGAIEDILYDPDYVVSERNRIIKYFYNNSAICDSEEIKDEYFLKCYSDSNQSNAGIFAVKQYGKNTALTVNDAAKRKVPGLTEYNGSITIYEIEAAFR